MRRVRARTSARSSGQRRRPHDRVPRASGDPLAVSRGLDQDTRSGLLPEHGREALGLAADAPLDQLALLQDRIALVPEREGEAEALPVIADASQAILAPPIGAKPCLVVVVLGITVVAVVLTNRAPLPLAQVRPPLLPGDRRFPRAVQPLLLGIVERIRLSRRLPLQSTSARSRSLNSTRAVAYPPSVPPSPAHSAAFRRSGTSFTSSSLRPSPLVSTGDDTAPDATTLDAGLSVIRTGDVAV